MADDGARPIERGTLASLTPDTRNARRHTERNVGMIEASLAEVGAGRSIVLDREGNILAGNATAEAAAAAGMTDVIIVPTDGRTLVAVRRDDIEPGSAEGVRLALYDNRAAELAEWEPAVLAGLAEEGYTAGLFSDEEMAGVLAEIGGLPNDNQGPASNLPPTGPTLADRFLVPPFSVLDARQGYWRERKAQWLALGIKSELGRGGSPDSGAVLPVDPGSAGNSHSMGLLDKRANARAFGQDVVFGEGAPAGTEGKYKPRIDRRPPGFDKANPAPMDTGRRMTTSLVNNAPAPGFEKSGAVQPIGGTMTDQLIARRNAGKASRLRDNPRGGTDARPGGRAHEIRDEWEHGVPGGRVDGKDGVRSRKADAIPGGAGAGSVWTGEADYGGAPRPGGGRGGKSGHDVRPGNASGGYGGGDAWLAAGSKGNGGLTISSRSGADPTFYQQKRAAEARLGRELTTAEFEADHYVPSTAEGLSGAGTSVFDPVLCELAYRWFSPAAGVVLDPFAGGSVRGVTAAILGRRYVGVDLSARQIDANRVQADRLVPAGRPVPSWVVGDALDVRSLTAELLDPDAVAAPGSAEADLRGPAVDFVFSCPPYADLERYSDDPRDLSTMDYPAFVAAYRRIVAECAALLRPDRFAAFVVGDIRDGAGNYRGLVGDTIEAFRAAGLHLYNQAILVTPAGSLPVRVGRQFAAGRKLGTTHQYVLVFLKGNARKATEACGLVDTDFTLPEPEEDADAEAEAIAAAEIDLTAEEAEDVDDGLPPADEPDAPAEVTGDDA